MRRARTRATDGLARRWSVAVFVLLAGCRNEFVVATLAVVDTEGDSASSGADDVGASVSSSDEGTSIGATGSGSEDASSGASSSSGGEPQCTVPAHAPCETADDPLRAIGLGCEGEAAVVLGTFAWNDFNTWKLPRQYGDPHFSAPEGQRMLALTTGTLPQPDASGVIVLGVGQTDQVSGNNGNPDAQILPDPILPQPGSAAGRGGTPYEGCDGVGDCSDSLPEPWQAGAPADDLVWLSFEVEVPELVQGYGVDLAWFTAEYPERIDAPANDLFVWWQTSEAFTGNVATLEGAVLSVTEATPLVLNSGLSGEDPELVGSGYEGLIDTPCTIDGVELDQCPRGASTGWLHLAAPVTGGESITVALALFDLGDPDIDTAVLLDRFRWTCQGCDPGVDCGLNPR
jgi:hypothetical protein